MAYDSFTPASFTLDIINYTNSNFNGTNSSGLSSDDRLVFSQDQTTNIGNNLFSFNGSTLGVSQVDLGSGFREVGVTPVPESATVFGALGLVGLLGYRERRRISRVVKSALA